jgi:hypothetical protein
MAENQFPCIGLHLYTLREMMEKDFIGILALVAEIGFKDV